MAESTVWSVMYPDGSRTVVGHYPLALAYAKGDRSRIEEITLDLHPGPLTKLQRKAIAVCFTSDKVSVSEVQRKLSISYADAQTLCQSIVDLGLTDELELAPSLKRGAPAPHPAPVAQGDAREETNIGKAVNRAARDLPEGWEIRIDLERHAGVVHLIDPEGNETMIEGGGELFSDQISTAIDAARSQAKEGA